MAKLAVSERFASAREKIQLKRAFETTFLRPFSRPFSDSPQNLPFETFSSLSGFLCCESGAVRTRRLSDALKLRANRRCIPTCRAHKLDGLVTTKKREEFQPKFLHTSA